MNSQVRLNRRFVKFGCVDIDLDLERARGERLPVIAGLTDVEPRSQNQKNIGTLYGEVSGAIANRTLPSAKQGIVRGDDVVGPSGGYRDSKAVDEIIELRDRLTGANAGASQNHGTLRVSDAFENALAVRPEPRRIAGNRVRGGSILRWIVSAEVGRVDDRSLDVNRNIQPARAGTSTLREVPCTLKVISN